MLAAKTLLPVFLGLLGVGCGEVEVGSVSEASALGDSYFRGPAPAGSAAAWSFVPVSGMTCADGSATGIGVNFASRASGKLLIYLEGGGGCWDVTTCRDSLHIQNANLGGFDATAFQQVMVTGSSRYVPAIPANYGAMGIWDRTSSENPFRDYDYVYIPYCTADFHAGNLPQSPADGLSHVGYRNMTRALVYLADIHTPSSTKQVVLCGGSAGGFGALWNFPQTQAAFGPIPVTLLAESGPPLPAPYLASALEEAWRVAWGLDGTKSAAAPSTHFFPYLQWIARTHPSRKLNLVAMTGDIAISRFLGVSLVGENSLSNGLFSMRVQLQSTSPGASVFLIPTLAHTVIHQAPESWPAPSLPYGMNNLTLSRWLDLAVH